MSLHRHAIAWSQPEWSCQPATRAEPVGRGVVRTLNGRNRMQLHALREPACSADSISSTSPAPASDLARLVRRADAGDHRAWTLLVERLGPKLRATARRFRLSHADVDDVVQSTWLAAYRNIGQLSRLESFEAWIDSTARRAALRLLQQGVREVLTSDLPHLAASADDCPARRLIEREERDAL